jgi:nicotinate-nucleotide pyrophosphorylase (carboxylating)
MFDVAHPEVRGAVERALAEDIGSGDITSEFTVPAHLQAHGSFLAKEEMVLAGIELLPLVYEIRGGAEVALLAASGSPHKPGDVLATVAGSARTLLECERVALNFLQRLSGVATLARKYVDQVAGTKARVLDTRKTTPGLRQLEKMAAAAGGATNHRNGLFDAVLVKNNHITAAGGVREALQNVKRFSGPVDHLLLDNLSPAEAAEWIRYIGGRATVELSGGINLKTIRAYADAGPDFISSGAITHSAVAVDISFRLELDK